MTLFLMSFDCEGLNEELLEQGWEFGNLLQLFENLVHFDETPACRCVKCQRFCQIVQDSFGTCAHVHKSFFSFTTSPLI